LEIGYVDLSQLFCKFGECSIYKDDKLLLRDIGHFSNESTYVVTKFLSQLNIFSEKKSKFVISSRLIKSPKTIHLD